MIIIVGSGIAGLTAALTLHELAGGGPGRGTGQIMIVTKAEGADSNTRYAQGGIAAALFAGDSDESHMADTLAAGAGLADPDAVRFLCGRGPRLVRELIERGVAFDRAGRSSGADPSSSADHSTGGDAHGDCVETLARGREGAHSAARIVHAGGDATGAVVEAALLERVRRAGITIHEHTFLADLLTERQPGDSLPRVSGVRLIGPGGARRDVAADAVVLASGGAGQLYSHTTNPLVATGDGAAAAWRAGAVIADAEFYQFHPTALALGRNFLISEAVRGEGAVLVDDSGRRFMPGVHPDAELAPRDVVARGIARAMAAQDGRPVRLDVTELARKLGADGLAARFPSIDAACRRHGLDWAREPIPVTPSAHYWMGGVRTDLRGRTSLTGLYAVGEVARTGVHGANRLASNSLLEGLVFADAAARDLAAGDYVAGWSDGSMPDFGSAATLDVARPDGGARPAGPARPDGAWPPLCRADLQQLMWDKSGLFREAGDLEVARKQLAAWHPAATATATATANPPSGPQPVDNSEASSPAIADLETENLRQLGTIVVEAALARRESRGAHYRADHSDAAPNPRSLNVRTSCR